MSNQSNTYTEEEKLAACVLLQKDAWLFRCEADKKPITGELWKTAAANITD